MGLPAGLLAFWLWRHPEEWAALGASRLQRWWALPKARPFIVWIGLPGLCLRVIQSYLHILLDERTASNDRRVYEQLALLPAPLNAQDLGARPAGRQPAGHADKHAGPAPALAC